MRIFQRRPSRNDFDREALPHLSSLYGAALRLTRNEDDAADLVQEAMLRAYRFFDTFEAGTNCRAWLFRILTNVFRNRYRERERETEILNEAESSDANIARFTGHAFESTETALLGRMVSTEVETALRAIPAEFRLAVILADLEDFSYKEIAEIMDCPAGTVMSRLFRGRKLLQKLLLDYAVEQGIVQENLSGRGSHNDNNDGLRDGGKKTVDLDSYRRERGLNRANGNGGKPS